LQKYNKKSKQQKKIAQTDKMAVLSSPSVPSPDLPNSSPEKEGMKRVKRWEEDGKKMIG